MARICITGPPRSGKTTRADSSQGLVGPVRHTDDLIALGWSEASLVVSTWFDEPGPWVIEGVALPRALRKWLARNPVGRPCDVVLWLETPREPLRPGQATMAEGMRTVWNEIAGELEMRGVLLTSEK